MSWSWSFWVSMTSESRLMMSLMVRAAPRLKDAAIPDEEVQGLYVELVVAMRRMYQQCRLVHGDLSEYNIL